MLHLILDFVHCLMKTVHENITFGNLSYRRLVQLKN